ncbi:TetR family transcriptional regulator [Virgibacillus sp. W0181]|uniref:TetR family transcriptional regulator n=1 Tax=Virgibacillus sp. W0181 TaxID=3391581 RepID=UPI003F470BB0
MSKRDNIISAAIDIFTDKGIEKTTISDIVNKAGIAQGTFYLYFTSKMALMPAIAQVLVNKMNVRLQHDVRAEYIEQQLDEVIDVMFKFTYEFKDLTKLMYIGMTQTEHLHDWEEIYTPLYQWLENLLSTAQSAKNIRADINIKYTAKIIIGMIETAAEQNYLFDDQQPTHIESHRKELKKLVKYALGIS